MVERGGVPGRTDPMQIGPRSGDLTAEIRPSDLPGGRRRYSTGVCSGSGFDVEISPLLATLDVHMLNTTCLASGRRDRTAAHDC